MRIGLFLNNLDEEYQTSVYKGVRDEAAAKGLDLICIQGETLYNYRDRNPDELFPSREFICADGILILTSTIMDRTVSSPLQALRQFIKVPLVSIGSRFPDYPSIIVRNSDTMTLLMEHLVVFHAYRKLLYLGGPVEHPANLVREHIFCRTINAMKDRFPGLEGRVINGEFRQTSAIMMMREYIGAHRDDPPDVIVAGNDNIALGALKLLNTIGDSRWEGCRVTGFDDIEQARLENPSLTTIWQPLENMGRLAVKTLLDLINGQKVDETIYIESELRIRNSCGCTALPKNRKGKNAADHKVSRTINRPEYHLQNMSLLGQAFISINSLNEMISPLRFFLTNMAVKGFFLILYPQPLEHPGNVGNLIYYRTAHGEYHRVDSPETLEMTDFFSHTIAKHIENSPSAGMAWCVYYLRSGREYLGLIVYEAPDGVHPQICNAGVFLSNTVKRLQIHDDEKGQIQRLEREVAIRTKDLGETYRKLREEVQRRMAVEAEVLKISEMERLRFSMDLHDDICQRLAGISMLCKSFINGASFESFLPELSELIDETLARTRRYAHDSFPMELDVLGLKEALDALCHTVSRQNACRCVFSWSAPEKSLFNSVQDLNIYRIVQEALQNAVKHAGAAVINVDIRAANGIFSVNIRDSGIGDPQLNEEKSDFTDIQRFIKRGGLGLRSMRYRAHQLGAEYIFESSEKGGTRIEINIPLP